jgi:hypothetical protein
MTNKYEWLNKDSRKFLERGYLLEGETAEQRIRDIAEAAENYLNLKQHQELITELSVISGIVAGSYEFYETLDECPQMPSTHSIP